MNDSAFEEKVDHPSHYNAGRIEVKDYEEQISERIFERIY